MLVGCATTHTQSGAPDSSFKKVYPYAYDQVWRAAQLSIVRYPTLINNMESGVLETDYIKGDSMWVSPGTSKSSNLGRRYRIRLQIFKGSNSQNQPGVLVSVKKTVELTRDFFSETEDVRSDGNEEATILYRIERELAIEKALRKSVDTKN